MVPTKKHKIILYHFPVSLSPQRFVTRISGTQGRWKLCFAWTVIHFAIPVGKVYDISHLLCTNIEYRDKEISKEGNKTVGCYFLRICPFELSFSQELKSYSASFLIRKKLGYFRKHYFPTKKPS